MQHVLFQLIFTTDPGFARYMTQPHFPLEPVSQGVFEFEAAGIRLEFDAAKPTFTIKQGGSGVVFTKY